MQVKCDGCGATAEVEEGPVWRGSAFDATHALKRRARATDGWVATVNHDTNLLTVSCPTCWQKTADFPPHPGGETCGACAHFEFCKRLFRCPPGNTTCDWSPSRFVSASEAPVRIPGVMPS